MRLFLLLFPVLVFAQPGKHTDWLRYEQFGISYRLPADWEVDGFGDYAKSGWEEHGSAVCNCTGTINSSDSLGIKMVIYPSTQAGLDSAKRYQVWDYTWLPDSTITRGPIDFSTRGAMGYPNLRWAHRISKWSGRGEEAGKTVWQLKTCADRDFFLLVYFWGSADVIQNQGQLLIDILSTIEPSVPLVPVQKGKKWGYMRQSALKDKYPLFTIEPTYTSAGEYLDKLNVAKASIGKGKTGLIDSKGFVAVPFIYDDLVLDTDLFDSELMGRFIIFKKGLRGIYQLSLGEIIPPQYENIEWVMPEVKYAVVSKQIKGKSLYGIWGMEEKMEVIDCRYETPEAAKAAMRLN